MRKIFIAISLTLSVLLLAGSAFSQSDPVGPEIVIKISVSEIGSQDLPLKINRSPKAVHEQWFGAGRSCSHCYDDPGPWEYRVAARAYRGKDRAKIGLTV